MISVRVVEDSSQRVVLQSPVTRARQGVMVLAGLGWTVGPPGCLSSTATIDRRCRHWPGTWLTGWAGRWWRGD
jgi:hypothetical protein